MEMEVLEHVKEDSIKVHVVEEEGLQSLRRFLLDHPVYQGIMVGIWCLVVVVANIR